MTNIPIKIQFVKSLPTAQPSRIVAVKADGDTAFSLWVTDKTGIPYPLKNLQNNVIITNTDGNLQITSSSTSTNINLASSILATINSALQSGDNISELVNNVGYLTTFTETDPVFQASEASLFVSGDKFNLDNQSGINSGDQDSIVGISGTKAQFNTELTDGDFLFEGDITQYTDELAQDAVGSILTETATIDFTYDDITPTVSANVKLNSIDATHLADGINITEFTNNANYETTSQLNIRDTNSRNRVNHTGEQPISTVTGLQTNLDLKQDALTFTPENVANKATTLTASSTLYPNNDAVIAGLALKEGKVNKVTSIGLSANDTNYPSELAVKTYADNLVVGMLNDRGVWDASVNAFPTTGGSGVGGAIRKGDMWYISVAGTLGGKAVGVGDSFRALVNAPAQVAANWSILEANIGYVPANDANVVHLTGAETITGVKSFSPTLNAVGNGQTLTGLDIAPTFNTGAFSTITSPLRVTGGTTTDSFLGLFSQKGIAPSVSNILPTSGRMVSVQGAGGAYYMGKDVANNIEFIMGSSSAGSVFTGSITNHDFDIRTQNVSKIKIFNTTGNSVIQNGGTFTDDGVNRLQVAGTISSGTTTAGNTPPTANNQLTRKDYVDTGLAGREPSFAKNTAFNKNFGTTAGTVVEGGTLGSNAYTSTVIPTNTNQLTNGAGFITDISGKVEKVTGKSLLSDTEITRLGTMTITSDAEMQAGTDNTKYSTALRIATWFTWIKTQAQTWVAKQTFALAPRFSSVTASQFLKVDGNKDLSSVSEASDAEMQAGTENTKPITALRIKNWFTWRLTQPFTFGNLAGTGNRVVQVNSSGDASAPYNIQDGFTTDSDVITTLTAATYNSGNNYTATITPANSKVFNQGQFYKNAGVLYFATADNQVSRITLS